MDNNLSEFNFIRLLSSIMIVKWHSKIIENKELERKLMNFLDDEEVNILFVNFHIIDDYIDLENGFEGLYNFKFLTPIKDVKGNDRSIINISLCEAKNAINNYDEKYIIAMEKLYDKLYGEDQVIIHKVKKMIK